MNSGIGSSFRAISPNIARDVCAFVAVFAGRRRRRFTVSLPFETVVINRTTFWSFQANSMTFPSSDKLPYNVPHFKAEFHLVLSFVSPLFSSRLGSVLSRCALVPS